MAWATLAVALAAMVGGSLVTTYSAGMAVPDWPTTFGHPPLLYPPHQWLIAADVFLEHIHRLLGYLLSIMTLALAVLVWRSDRRPGPRRLAGAAAAACLLVVLLGGFRIRCDEIALANLHACAAPLLLALLGAIVVGTSADGRRAANATQTPSALEFRRWMGATTTVVYLQMVLGTQLRHLPVDAPTQWFGLLVWLHLIVAGVLAILATMLVVRARRRWAIGPRLRRRVWWFFVLVVGQLALGAASWVTQFGWPGWFTDLTGSWNYTVAAEGPWQVLAVTAHVTVGMICLLVGVSGVGRRDLGISGRG
ncbi:MAG: COX15/CtaA family protein [Pirellulales bacterium]|nr:COX15/CtaA family protein [Pirellulales bacterium]